MIAFSILCLACSLFLAFVLLAGAIRDHATKTQPCCSREAKPEEPPRLTLAGCDVNTIAQFRSEYMQRGGLLPITPQRVRDVFRKETGSPVPPILSAKRESDDLAGR